ncbi:hypothetical protein BpHYR1_012506 [Brachionus plicatilis]|uniref:Uncharacterized protein n=1 Tax=Brachionus plicatilis TaxID=10195 RepID=A0A3M7QJQ9_BRAPC|nr:hypothetical protein BpHYR1_012506 [Brachionus plicatilis]
MKTKLFSDRFYSYPTSPESSVDFKKGQRSRVEDSRIIIYANLDCLDYKLIDNQGPIDSIKFIITQIKLSWTRIEIFFLYDQLNGLLYFFFVPMEQNVEIIQKSNYPNEVIRQQIRICDLNKKIENYINFYLNMQYKIQFGFAVKIHNLDGILKFRIKKIRSNNANLDTLTLEGPQPKVGLKNPLGTYGIKKFGLSSILEESIKDFNQLNFDHLILIMDFKLPILKQKNQLRGISNKSYDVKAHIKL